MRYTVLYESGDGCVAGFGRKGLPDCKPVTTLFSQGPQTPELVSGIVMDTEDIPLQ
jgi:hypothetical protein